MSFVGILQQLVGTIAPWWLRAKHTGALLESYALLQDNAIESLGAGLRLSQPLRCDSSALPIISRDRSLRIYPTEPDASKRYRLSRWKQLHRGFGTHLGQLENLAPVLLPSTTTLRIVHQDGAGNTASWWTRDPDGTRHLHQTSPSNWNFDGATAKWSRYWVIIYRPVGAPAVPKWGDGGLWGDAGRVWGGWPLSAAMRADIVSAIQESGAVHSKLWGVICCNDPTKLDPAGTSATLGDGSTTYPVGNWYRASDPSTGKPTRPPYIEVLYNLGKG